MRRLPLWRLRLARLRRLRLLLVMGTLPHLLRALLQSPGAITAAGLRQGTPSATFIAPIVADWVRQEIVHRLRYWATGSRASTTPVTRALLLFRVR